MDVRIQTDCAKMTITSSPTEVTQGVTSTETIRVKSVWIPTNTGRVSSLISANGPPSYITL